jgi:hypothetical protein
MIEINLVPILGQRRAVGGRICSRFILEVFPYVSAALIAAVIVPGYLYSQAHGFRAVATPTFPPGNENALEVIHRDHAAFAPYQSGWTEASTSGNPHLTEDKLAYR